MDHAPRRIGGEDRHEQQDRALGVGGRNLQHLRGAGFQIDGAVNIQAFTPAVGRNRDLLARTAWLSRADSDGSLATLLKPRECLRLDQESLNFGYDCGSVSL